MPRAALLSIHARVARTPIPATWEDPSLVQLWGPRYSVFVVAARDVAVFTLGTLPDDARAGSRAAGRRRPPARRARRHPDDLRAGGPRARRAPQPAAVRVTRPARSGSGGTARASRRSGPYRRRTTDPHAARLELTRRYLHIYGPATAESFGRWAGIGRQARRGGLRGPGRCADAGRTPIGEGWILTRDEAAFRAAPGPVGTGAAAAQRGCLFPAARRRSRPAGPGPRAPPRAVDAAGLARLPCWSGERSPERGAAPTR